MGSLGENCGLDVEFCWVLVIGGGVRLDVTPETEAFFFQLGDYICIYIYTTDPTLYNLENPWKSIDDGFQATLYSTPMLWDSTGPQTSWVTCRRQNVSFPKWSLWIPFDLENPQCFFSKQKNTAQQNKPSKLKKTTKHLQVT